MRNYCTRRAFLAGAAGATAGVALLGGGVYGQKTRGRPRHTAVVADSVSEQVLSAVKGAGFGGLEAPVVTPAEANQARQRANRLGLRIHSVLRGWAEFNSRDFGKVTETLEVTFDALAAARAYGADTILLVPGRIGGMAMPQPWEFEIAFDEQTGYLTRVAAGDNQRYAEYIDAHNRAYDAFQAGILKLIPAAEQAGVVIAVENVWNNLFVDPRHFAFFLDSFRSRWVRAYFDIANHAKYSRPQRWIEVLGGRIVKCHVKDFKLNPDGHGGEFVPLGDGSVDWPAVMAALDEIDYRGWLTIEGSRELSLSERSDRLEGIQRRLRGR